MTTKETVRLLMDSLKIIEEVSVPHRNLQKQLDQMVESIMEEIMIEIHNTDLRRHVENLDSPWDFIEEWLGAE